MLQTPACASSFKSAYFSLDSAEKIGRYYMCCFLCFIWVSALQLSQRTHTYLVKYIVFEQIQFREIHFAFCFAFSKYQGCGCLQRHTSLNAGLLTVEHQQHI